jgi:hypothetical protein
MQCKVVNFFIPQCGGYEVGAGVQMSCHNRNYFGANGKLICVLAILTIQPG